MKKLFVPIGLLLFFALCLVPTGQAQQGSNLSFAAGEPFQVGLTWSALTSGSGSLTQFNVTGLQFFTVNWVVSGSISACTVTLDGASIPGGSFSTGSIVASQTCNSTGTYTTPSATENVRAQLSYSFSGAGSVTFTVRGYTENPATASGAASNVNVTSPVDGSGYVNVDCKTGCASGNPNGQATMANSAPVVIASNQSNLPTNLAQIAGANTAVNNGISGAAVQRVTVASDSTGVLGATQSGTWNVRTQDGSGNGLTSNSTTYTAKFAQDENLLGTLGTAFSTAGKVDVKGADGDLFVRQTTGSNLHVQVDTAPTTAVTESGTWNVRAQDGAGNALTSNSTTFTSKFGLDTNLLGTLGTAFSTAGKVDVKGADGDVFVRQTTGSNLHVQVDTAPTTAVTQSGTWNVRAQDGAGNALTSNSTTYTSKFGLDVNLLGSDGTAFATAGVVDQNLKNVNNAAVATAASGVQKVGIVGNAGATVDAAVAAGTAPTNGVAALGQYNTTTPAPAAAQTVAAQLDQAANSLEFPGVQFKAGAAWTSGTSQNTLQYPTGTTTAGALFSAPAVLVQLDQTTTLTAGAVTWQGSYDNTNWVTIPVAQVLNPNTFAQLTNPYTFVASTNQPFLLLTQGYSYVRANLTTAITGTGSVTPEWATMPSSILTTTLPATAMPGTVPGTAPQYTEVAGGIFNSAAPSPSTGQTSPLQQDAAASLYVAFRSSTNGCASNNGAIASVPLNASTTSAVQLVALSAGKKIYVCAITVLGGGTTPTFSLESGTGSNCATGNTVRLQPMAIPTAAPAQTFPGTVLVTAAGEALCTHLGGTSPTAVGVLSYVQ
jgi:hypothetical protein